MFLVIQKHDILCGNMEDAIHPECFYCRLSMELTVSTALYLVCTRFVGDTCVLALDVPSFQSSDSWGLSSLHKAVLL